MEFKEGRKKHMVTGQVAEIEKHESEVELEAVGEAHDGLMGVLKGLFSKEHDDEKEE